MAARLAAIRNKAIPRQEMEALPRGSQLHSQHFGHLTKRSSSFT
jgi:hypothetical protein